MLIRWGCCEGAGSRRLKSRLESHRLIARLRGRVINRSDQDNFMKDIRCAYCGKAVTQKDKEHVFPKCLYPSSKAGSRVQRLTIPSCRDCNNGWADDEAHFRNVLAVAGEPNASRQELWDTTIQRSFEQVDGLRRMNDLIATMKLVDTDGGLRHKVYPGEDERVLHVIRKIIKGLCYYHNVISPIPDDQIWADVLKYAIPQEFLDQMKYHHRDHDIAEYRYQVLNDSECSVAIMMWYNHQHDLTQKNQSICAGCALGLSTGPGHVSVVSSPQKQEDLYPTAVGSVCVVDVLC